MQHDAILIQPIMTEKAVAYEAIGKYTFRVHPNANKMQVRRAVEKIFSTKVREVNIFSTVSKKRRRGKTIGIVSGYKKAVVTLEKGQKIVLRKEVAETKKKNISKTQESSAQEEKIDTKKAKVVVRQPKRREGKQSR